VAATIGKPGISSTFAMLGSFCSTSMAPHRIELLAKVKDLGDGSKI